MNLYLSPTKAMSISLWKVAPALINPKGIFFIHKHSPRSGERYLLLVFLMDSDLNYN